MKYLNTILLILSVLVFPADAQEWTPSLSAINDPFSLDMDGNYAIVGSPMNGTDQNGQNDIHEAGAAFIYQRTGAGGWALIQKIVPIDRDDQDRFGYDVAISAEGYALVGTQYKNAAYFFEWNGGDWSEIQKIEGEQLQSFGFSVAMHGDKALIGAPGDNDFEGAAYLYQRDPNAGQWVAAKIMRPPAAEQQSFGNALDISETYIIIGAPFFDGSESDVNVGAAYIFSAADGTFVRPLDFPELQPGDKLGTTVAISESTAIVGIPEHALDDNGADDQDAQNDGLLHPGIVGIFSGASWNLQKIVSPDRDPNDQFGVCVDIQGDMAIVGANQEGLDADGGNFEPFAGLTYILERGGSGSWSVVDKIDASDRDSFDNYGSKVAIGSFGASVIGGDKTYFYNRCTESEISDLIANSTSVCQGENVLLTAVGDLADGQVLWYTGSCGDDLLGSGNTFEVTPEATITYFVSAGGCNTQISCAEITITVNPLPQIEASTTSEMMGNGGMINLSVSGGSPPYTYDWDTDENNDFDDPEDLEGLSAGTYLITVMDNNGCIASSSITLAKETVTGLTIDPNALISVYPNPHTEGMVYIELAEGSITELTIRDLSGKLLGRHTLVDSEPLDLNSLQKGIYLLEFLFENKRLTKRWVKL